MKPLAEFYGHPATRSKVHSACKACFKERCRAHRQKHPGRWKVYELRASLRRRYGITLPGYHRLVAAQQGACAICGTEKASARTARLHVDHDHATGVVRGLLCGNCNNGLGRFAHSIERLEQAAAYLRRRAA